jgi:hypothetical protein
MIFHDFGMATASLVGSLETKLAAVRSAGFSQVMIAASDVVSHPGGTAAGVGGIKSGLEFTGLAGARATSRADGPLRRTRSTSVDARDLCGARRADVVEASIEARGARS